jgi:flagellar biosynthetic protein FliQ
MTPETVIDILRNALEVGGTIAGPLLAECLAVGTAVGVVQATTQVNDMTMVFVPKVLAVIATLVLFGGWMMQQYIEFTQLMLRSLATPLG